MLLMHSSYGPDASRLPAHFPMRLQTWLPEMQIDCDTNTVTKAMYFQCWGWGVGMGGGWVGIPCQQIKANPSSLPQTYYETKEYKFQNLIWDHVLTRKSVPTGK